MNKFNWLQARDRLRSEVDRRFGAEFQPSNVPAIPGTLAFLSAKGAPLSFYLLFQRSDTHNAFYTELAWSVLGHWPANPSIAADVPACRTMPEGRFRIEQFWLPPPVRMQAWCLTKPLGLRQLLPGHDDRKDENTPVQDIGSVVDQCCDKIRDVVLPLMCEIRSNLRAG